MSIEEFANLTVCKHLTFNYDITYDVLKCTICGKEWSREELLGDDDDLSN